MSSAAQSLLSWGGGGVARLDRRPRARRVLRRAVPFAIPIWFDPEAAHGLEATFELRLLGPGGEVAERVTVSISDDRCSAARGAATKPGATVTIGTEDMIRVASGAVGWPELLSSGQLELTGDPFLALRFPTLFRLPVSA